MPVKSEWEWEPDINVFKYPLVIQSLCGSEFGNHYDTSFWGSLFENGSDKNTCLVVFVYIQIYYIKIFFFFHFFFFYLCWILSYIEMKQPWVYMCSLSQPPLYKTLNPFLQAYNKYSINELIIIIDDINIVSDQNCYLEALWQLTPTPQTGGDYTKTNLCLHLIF